MKLFVSIPIFLCLMGFLFLSDTMLFRALIAKNYECSFPQIRYLPKDADFLAFGSSRVHIAILPQKLEDESRQIERAYNVAMPGGSSIRTYSWLKGMIDAGYRPKTIYYEANLVKLNSTSRHTEWKHNNWDIMASYGDHLALGSLYKKIPLLTKFYIIEGGLVRKLDASLNVVLGGRLWRAAEEARSQHEAPKACVMERFYEAPDQKSLSQIASRKKRYEKFVKQSGRTNRKYFKIGHSWIAKEELYYIRTVRKLAKENDIDLIVSRPWQAYEKPLSPTALATLRKTIPEFVYPPTDVIRETWPAFQDPKHMSFRAADIYTEWLAREIDARAEEAPQS